MNLEKITSCGIAAPSVDCGFMLYVQDGIRQMDISVIYVSKNKILLFLICLTSNNHYYFILYYNN